MSEEVAAVEMDVEVQDHATCGRCHRALKNAASRKIGFGPVCLKKIGIKVAFDEYQKLADGDEQIALKFLIKTYGEEKVKAAIPMIDTDQTQTPELEVVTAQD